MRRAIVTATLLSLLSGTALAHENADLKRIDATAVELTRPSSAPVEVWTSSDTTLDQGDRQVARRSKATTLRVEMPADERGYVILRDARGEATVVGERLVPLAQGSNFRDLGGYPAAGGKHVRWGMIYRSGATPVLSEADLKLVQSLGLREMIDLRSSDERELAPSKIAHVPYSAIGYSMEDRMPGLAAGQPTFDLTGTYRQAPDFLAPHLAMIFAKLLREESPLVYNCSAGQDRTGFATAMVLTALGVPRETIIEDYHLSTLYRRPEFELSPASMAAHPDNPIARLYALGAKRFGTNKPQVLKTAEGVPFLAFAFAEIEQRWGSVDAYLEKEIGVDAQDIATLRAMYLE